MVEPSLAMCQLIAFALWQKPCNFKSLQVEEYRALMRLAKAQTVSGLVCQGMVDAEIETDDDCALESMETIRRHEQSTSKLNEALSRLVEVLNKEGIVYAVFKGEVMAALYPQPAMRTCGDIDFYVVPQDFERALKLIESTLGVEVHEDYTDKHFDFEVNGIRFEMHYRIETFGCSRHQRLFNQWHDEALLHSPAVYRQIGETRVRVLPPEIEVVTVFKHLFNHLLIEGVGLRQFVDLAVLIYRLDLDKAAIDRVIGQLRRLGYLRAFQATLQVLQTYIGFEPGADWKQIVPVNRKYVERIYQAVMTQGNFGRQGRVHQEVGAAKSMETLKIAMRHCLDYFWLAPTDIACLIPKRVGISMKKYV